jgi:type IV pilus assembly protein PilO
MKKMSDSLHSIEPVFDKIAKLTKLQRVLVSAGVLLLIIAGFVYLLYMPKYKQISKLNKEYQKEKKELETARANAQQLGEYKALMKQAEERFKIASKKLPDKKEIPSLLAGISSSGQQSGLEFFSFTPQPDKKVDFYAELPVSIEVNGGYHSVALFFDRVSHLSRIVNIKDIEMKRTKNDNTLTTKCTAVTYRFVEQEPKKTEKKETDAEKDTDEENDISAEKPKRK